MFPGHFDERPYLLMLVIFILVAVAVMRCEDIESQACKRQGGVLVRGVRGWVCAAAPSNNSEESR